MLDRKGIFSYLAITFIVTYLIEGALILSGLRMHDAPPIYGQLAIAGVMWVPALATVLTIKFVTREGFAITNLRFGSWRPYVAAALLMPAAFAVIYGLTWLLGLGEPDWQLVQFRQMMAAAGQGTGTDFNRPRLAVAFLSPSSSARQSTVFWLRRGVRLAICCPSSCRWACGPTFCWASSGLWRAADPGGFNYPGYPVLGIIAMMGFMTAVGIYLNEMTLRHRSSILAGSIHGALNGQGYGIWGILFPSVNPLLGGVTGLVGMAVWLAIGLWLARRHYPASGAVTASSQVR